MGKQTDPTASQRTLRGSAFTKKKKKKKKFTVPMASSANGDIMQVFIQERNSLFPNLITVTRLPPQKPWQGMTLVNKILQYAGLALL